MQKFARVVDGVAVDVTASDPAELFHPAVAAEFIPVPDEVQPGSTLDAKGAWSPPPAGETAETSPALTYTLDVPAFMLRFTAAERIGIRARAASDPVIEDFMLLLNDPRTQRVQLQLPSVQQAVAYLAGQAPGVGGKPLDPPVLAPERIPEILAGEPAHTSL